MAEREPDLQEIFDEIGPEPEDLIVRPDKYNISIGGIIIRATPEQELRIRGLTPEQLSSFRRIMGG